MALLSTVQLLYAGFAVALSFHLVRYRLKQWSIAHVRGPPSPSWLLGYHSLLLHQLDVGELESKWFNEYGNTLRIAGCYNEQILYTCDPKTIQYIFQTASYHFPKPRDLHRNAEESFGRGLFSAEGADNHGRQRKNLLPAFSFSQLRKFQPVFELWGSRLSQKWKDEVLDGREIIDVSAWLTRLTLDIIGESAFRYKFNALDGGSSELAIASQMIFANAGPPTNLDVLYRILWRFLPLPILKALELIPTRGSKRFKNFFHVATKVCCKILEETRADDTAANDVLTVLIRGNMSEDPAKRLNDEEVTAQLGTLMFAGHDTTASTMAWMLWELSKHPEYQQKIREEFATVRAKKIQEGEYELTPADYDSMVYLDAVLKETLRFHPIIPSLTRQAGRDEILPLLEPITTEDGKVISEIPVSKGQCIAISISRYNRLPSLWGDDAETWNPKRFLGNHLKKQVSLGMTSNLMTFSAGIKGCIGWKFAMMELQAVLVQLLSSFEFSLPEGLEIHRKTEAFMVPLVKGRIEEGAQMPLRVSLVGTD